MLHPHLGPALANPARAAADDLYRPFEGEKSSWHDGFDRYDYLMDEATFEIQPFCAARKSIRHQGPAAGQAAHVSSSCRRSPRRAIPGRGAAATGTTSRRPRSSCSGAAFTSPTSRPTPRSKPGKKWDAWYAFLTEKHGLSKKPAFIGMSRGGEYAYTWATTQSDQVSCIYADNPGINPDVLKKLGDLAAADVPLLHVCGSIDPLLGRCPRRSRTSTSNSAAGSR